MSESKKALVQLGIIIGGFITFFARFFYQEASVLIWFFRIASIITTIFLLVFLITYYRTKDLVPDFLNQGCNLCFERDGFCFRLKPYVKEGVMFVLVAFQNRYDKHCKAYLALKLFSGLLEKDTLMQKILDIECPPAGYGTVNFPCAIPQKFQGKRARIEMGVDINYPEGKGKMLRFRDGIHVGVPNLTTSLTPLKALLGLLVGYQSYPAYLRFTLPSSVKDNVLNNLVSELKIIWQLS